jgi:hypothetical protein
MDGREQPMRIRKLLPGLRTSAFTGALGSVHSCATTSKGIAGSVPGAVGGAPGRARPA